MDIFDFLLVLICFFAGVCSSREEVFFDIPMASDIPIFVFLLFLASVLILFFAVVAKLGGRK